jgi:hypothetical protein
MSAINVECLLKKWFAFLKLARPMLALNAPARLPIKKSLKLFPSEVQIWEPQVHMTAVAAPKATSLEADDGVPAVSRMEWKGRYQ